MTGTDFYANVEKHPQLTWLGVHPETEEVCVEDSYLKLTHAIPLSEITSYQWGELCDVLTDRREARIMRHLTRIVGYFSRTSNWSGSKLEELNDRHKGDYAVKEDLAA